MRAQYALVDPLLTVGLPPAPTAQTGIDALAQAIGGAIVTNGNPLSMAVGLEACRYVAAALEPAVRDGSNVEARRAMSLASLLAGLSMNLSDCAADHALAQAMGGYLSLPHGLTVGLVLAETLDVSRAECAPALERWRCARRAGRRHRRRLAGRARGATAAGRGVAADGVRGGAAPEHVDELTPLALDEYFMTVDPHRWTADDVRGAYRQHWRWPPGEERRRGIPRQPQPLPDGRRHRPDGRGRRAPGHLGDRLQRAQLPPRRGARGDPLPRRSLDTRGPAAAARALRRGGAHPGERRACRCCWASRWT